ncbi:MAG: ribonuclease E/G, partial [Burkholderiales bacterium]
MESQKNQREVENRFREALRHDRARVQLGKISRFGLLELSRQRLQASLEETAHINCPRCSGTGFIRGTESTALHVLRIMQEEAMKENTGAVHVQVPVDAASFLLNEKRSEIQKLEARLKVNIVLVPNPHLETPHYKVQRLRHDELNALEHVPVSYELAEQPEEPKPADAAGAERRERQEAVVKAIVPDQPAPIVPEVRPQPPARAEPLAAPAAPELGAPGGFLGRILGWFKTERPETTPVVAANNTAVRTPRESRREGPQRERRPGQMRQGGERRDHRRDGRRDEHRDSRRGGRPEGQGRSQGSQGQGRDGQRQGGGERRPDQRPQPQPQQPRAPRGDQPQSRPAPAGAPAEVGEEQRRGRRGRRDRHRDHRPDQGREQTQGATDASPSAIYGTHLPEARDLRQAEIEMHRAQMRAETEAQAAVASPAPSAEAIAPLPVAEFRPAPEARRAEPEAPPAERVDTQTVLENAGLEMVETRSDRVPAPAPEPDTASLGRPRRERPSSGTQEDSLVQVETKH